MDNNEVETFPNPPDRVAEYREHYASYSRAQLIQEMHRWLPHAAQHIAAKQLIAEIDKKDLNKKHRIIITVAVLTFVVALLTFLVAIADFSWNRIHPLLSTNQKTQELNLNRTHQKKTSTSAVPQQEDLSSNQQE